MFLISIFSFIKNWNKNKENEELAWEEAKHSPHKEEDVMKVWGPIISAQSKRNKK